MKRREFLTWVGVGLVASSLPVAIAACSPTKESATPPPAPTPPPTPAATGTNSVAEGFQVVGTVTQLDKDGQILNKEFPGGPVLVVRNPDDRTVVYAVNPKCTHEGCTVKWEADERKYDCPCHDAEFSPDGQVIEGPAKKPLATYTAKIEGDSILVKSI
ncbi:MAG: hypothetical protein Fur0025_29070 [Oscillatoriaceae cyanobacterium]